MNWLAVAIFVWGASGVISAAVASDRGHNGFAWFVIGVLLGPLGVVLAIAMPPPSPRIAATAAPIATAADEIAKLADLHSKGLLTDDEFKAAKAKAIGGA